jgi:hypothetical protein
MVTDAAYTAATTTRWNRTGPNEIDIGVLVHPPESIDVYGIAPDGTMTRLEALEAVRHEDGQVRNYRQMFGGAKASIPVERALVTYGDAVSRPSDVVRLHRIIGTRADAFERVRVVVTLANGERARLGRDRVW